MISRDTAGANDGAITQEFDEAKRAEIAKGFEAAKTLTEQTAVFFNNRAADQREEEKKLEQLGSRDANGEWQPNPGLTTEQQKAFNEAKTKYTDLQNNFGATSPARMIATALTGAAGGNVAGNLTGLVQGAVVNVLQGLAVNQVKHIADSLLDGQGNPTASSEAVRAALQGLTACAGAAANGAGNCTSAASGASASVVINYLLTEFVDPQPKDANGNPIERTLEDQQARNNLVATLIGAIAAGAGIDPGSATNAAQVETENNDLAGVSVGECKTGEPNCLPEPQARAAWLSTPEVAQIIAETGLTPDQAWECLRGRANCDAQINPYRDQLINDLSKDGVLNAADAERIQKASLDELATIRQQTDADAANMTRLRDADPALADRLATESLAVRTLVYQDLASGRGDNPIGRFTGTVLSGVLSDEQMLDLYLGNLSDRTGEDKGGFDQAMQRGLSNLAANAQAQRNAADAEANKMLASGVPQELVNAFIFKEYANAAATEKFGQNLISSAKFVGDYFTDPTHVAGNVAVGGVQALDDKLLDDTSALEYLRRGGDAAADLANADIRTQATAVGNFAGNAATAVVEATVGYGIGRAVGSVPANAPDVAPEPIVPPRSPLGNLDEILPNPNTRVLSGTEANALTTPNRGVIYVQENATMSTKAQDFQSGCAGAFCDTLSGKDAAPALRYDNTINKGNNYVRFDGIEKTADGLGVILIDRKLKLADFNIGAREATEKTFERVAAAVKQNPGYQVVFEFPDAAVAQRARTFINQRGFGNVIGVRP